MTTHLGQQSVKCHSPQLAVPDRNDSPLAASSLSLQCPSSVVLQTAETASCRASVPAVASLHAERTARRASQAPRNHSQDLCPPAPSKQQTSFTWPQNTKQEPKIGASGEKDCDKPTTWLKAKSKTRNMQ